ncbi:MAG: CPBP family intramembrane metalloprotease [Bacteroidetes bacterium]|jgi:membrane protease YdiL (CAAX protease family)|nr:CPBP family intramembrane metalloprotease [Bacteroidota bacterium]
MEHRHIVVLAIAVEGGLVLLAWGLGALLGVPAFQGWHLTGPAVAWGLLACGPMLAALALAVRSSWPPLVRLRRTMDEFTDRLSRCTLLDLAVISALAGIGEEALFRGVMQTGLVPVVGLSGAIALTSVAFGLAHYLSLTYAAYAALVSVYLGALLVYTDNLLVPVLAHAAYDFVALVYLTRVRPASSHRRRSG